MFRRFLLLLTCLALFAAACTSEGVPSSFDDQDRRTEKQFVAACKGALEGEQEEGFCECAFLTIASDLSFEEFLELDKDLKDNPQGLSKERRELIEGISLPCAVSESDVYGA